MTPKNAYGIIGESSGEQRFFDKTYALGEERLGGIIDGKAAAAQAIFKILNTERRRYPVYSDGYGIEIADLFGKDTGYVYAELERRITEALTADERVLKVSGFGFSFEKNGVCVSFTAETAYGDIPSEKRFIYE